MQSPSPGNTSNRFLPLIEALTEPRDIVAPPGLGREAVLILTIALEDKGRTLPHDYAAFLLEANGMVWNGVQMFGTPGSCPLSPFHLLNANAQLDPMNRIGADRLIVGMSESFLYVHDPMTDGYERYLRADLKRDTATYPNFDLMLADTLIERQSLARVYKPPVDGPVI